MLEPRSSRAQAAGLSAPQARFVAGGGRRRRCPDGRRSARASATAPRVRDRAPLRWPADESLRELGVWHLECGVILGTAGHIDHGKTTLVKALTGVDTDR